jgi:hypothetical protein
MRRSHVRDLVALQRMRTIRQQGPDEVTVSIVRMEAKM